MTLFIIFAATWIAFYLARGFVTPIEKLAAGTERVSQGELGYQVDNDSLGPLEADFDGLVASFNSMSRQLRDQRRQLLQSAEELRASHHALGERNRLVELLLENIESGILSIDPQGYITALNRAAHRLVQPRTEAWLGRHYRVVLGREAVRLLDELLERLRSEANRQISRNITFTLNRKPVHVEATMLALENKDGQSEGVVAMLKDVTAIQRTQRAQAWREVARRIAHEIKNPLTPIQINAERIRRRYMDNGLGNTEVLDQATRTIISEVTSLKKMVNEFSQFAKLPESQPVPGDVNEVIREVAQLYENGLPEHIALQMDLAPDVPQIALDREQMKRALTNLIDNAAASMPEEPGHIVMATRYEAANRTVIVEVSDDGLGVPDSIRSRLFEPYTSTKDGGTGLGLTIVNQIVSDHSGYIRYADHKPRGSVFSMEFRVP